MLFVLIIFASNFVVESSRKRIFLEKKNSVKFFLIKIQDNSENKHFLFKVIKDSSSADRIRSVHCLNPATSSRKIRIFFVNKTVSALILIVILNSSENKQLWFKVCEILSSADWFQNAHCQKFNPSTYAFTINFRLWYKLKIYSITWQSHRNLKVIWRWTTFFKVK